MQEKAEQGDAILALCAALREEGNIFVQAELERYGITDLLPAHGAVLNALFGENPLRMQELARRIGRKKSTVTGLIDTLQTRGYCERVQDQEDGRGQWVRLCAKGEAVRTCQESISCALREKAWQGIEISDRAQCMETLSRVLANLRSHK